MAAVSVRPSRDDGPDGRTPAATSECVEALAAALADAGGGDREAMTRVYDLSAAHVLRLLGALLRDEHAVREAVVATYREIWRQAPRSVGCGSTHAWVLAIAVRCALTQRHRPVLGTAEDMGRADP